jgi:hypothetical protein
VMNAAQIMLPLKRIMLKARAEFSRAKMFFGPSRARLKWVLWTFQTCSLWC